MQRLFHSLLCGYKFIFVDLIKHSALFAVPYVLRDVANIFDQSNIKQPTILCRGTEIKLDDINIIEVFNGNSFAVMVEDCHIAFTFDLIYAFWIMIELHYVFNLSDAAPTQATIVFIQKLTLNLTDNYRALTKVLNLIAKITKNNLDSLLIKELHYVDINQVVGCYIYTIFELYMSLALYRRLCIVWLAFFWLT